MDANFVDIPKIKVGVFNANKFEVLTHIEVNDDSFGAHFFVRISPDSFVATVENANEFELALAENLIRGTMFDGEHSHDSLAWFRLDIPKNSSIISKELEIDFSKIDFFEYFSEGEFNLLFLDEELYRDDLEQDFGCWNIDNDVFAVYEMLKKSSIIQGNQLKDASLIPKLVEFIIQQRIQPMFE